MQIGFRNFVRSATTAMMGLVVAGASAGAQVNVTFYESYPASPNPLGAFGGGAVICTNTAVGTASGGFSLDFGDAATRAALCPGNPDRFDPVNGGSFGARFTGALNVASAGLYNVFLNVDDGNSLFVNGVEVRTDWVVKAAGPGNIQFQLNAGLNPFVLDYFQGPPVGAYATLTPGDGVSIDPPTTTVPEPSTFALTAVGALVVGALVRRRRRSMAE